MYLTDKRRGLVSAMLAAATKTSKYSYETRAKEWT